MQLRDYLAALALGLIGAAAAAWIGREVKLRVFKQKPWFSAPAFAAALLGIGLGVYGTFGVPASRDLFEAFAISPPVPTQWVFDFRYFLWAPLLVIALAWWLLRAHRTRTGWYLACFLAASLLLCLVLGVTIPPVDRLYGILRP